MYDRKQLKCCFDVSSVRSYGDILCSTTVSEALPALYANQGRMSEKRLCPRDNFERDYSVLVGAWKASASDPDPNIFDFHLWSDSYSADVSNRYRTEVKKAKVGAKLESLERNALQCCFHGFFPASQHGDIFCKPQH